MAKKSTDELTSHEKIVIVMENQESSGVATAAKSDAKGKVLERASSREASTSTSSWY